jgi:hypothetical protein
VVRWYSACLESTEALSSSPVPDPKKVYSITSQKSGNLVGVMMGWGREGMSACPFYSMFYLVIFKINKRSC